MNVTRRLAGLAVLGVCLLWMSVKPIAAQTPAPGQDQCSGPGQHYTVAEYNAYTAAANEKNPAAQLKALDDFVGKYPNSCLLNYIYPLYYQNYAAQKNFPKVMDYADKELALGDNRISASERYQAFQAIVYAFNNTQNPDAATAKRAFDAATNGVKSVEALPKPENMDEAAWADAKKKAALAFLSTKAAAAMAAKDFPGAVEAYKAVLAQTPDDFVANYYLGRAYSAMNPPQQLDAIWSFARAATVKTANEKQAKQVKDYLRGTALPRYQGGTVCDALTEAELNELLQLAATSVDRPASYKLASAADLEAARKEMTIASVFTDLKAGGDKAKLTWTAACGLEFPDVPGKLIEVTPGADVITLKLAFVTSEAEFDAKNTADMEVKIKTADQPDAAKLEKDSAPRFTGTLESYDPDPAFMLHWDKAKVNPDDLPKEGKKPATKKPAAKKP
ncbi:MAG TPA: hypothetical protein VMT75_11660 [Candidatus Saccharimonadales bacterium]|nr:hypothetical protein [Candidatus Saccharimonadales bacterium]